MQCMEIQGKHTAAALKELNLPRFQINVGDRNRVERALHVLKLGNAVLLDVDNGKLVGRKTMAAGDYTFTVKNGNGGKWEQKIRILIVETGMGMPSLQIIQEEMIKHAESVPIVQVRVGTAGGVNSEGVGEPVLKRGDLVCASFNVGKSLALEQKLGFFQKYTFDSEGREELFRFAEKLEKLGIGFCTSMRFLKNENDPYVVAAIAESAKSLRYTCHVGGTFSKSSLWAEDKKGLMFSLREEEGVIATEMEQLENAFLAAYTGLKHGVPVLTGMVAALTGAKPGDGFATNKKEELEVEVAVDRALQVAADAMARIFLKPGEKILNGSNGMH